MVINHQDRFLGPDLHIFPKIYLVKTGSLLIQTPCRVPMVCIVTWLGKKIFIRIHSITLRALQKGPTKIKIIKLRKIKTTDSVKVYVASCEYIVFKLGRTTKKP